MSQLLLNEPGSLQQLEFQKDLISRLQSQLDVAHAKLGYRVSPRDGVAGVDLPLWMLDPAALSPLLFAYDHRIEELESSSAALRDALSACRAQLDLQEQRQRFGAAPPPGARRPPAAAPGRRHEELELAAAECAALREEVTELEAESRDLRAAAEELESARHAHAAVQKQLSHSLQDAQATIKRLMLESSAAAAEAHRSKALLSEFEAGRVQLLAQIDALERERDELVGVAQRSNDEIVALQDKAHREAQRVAQLSAQLSASAAALSDARQETRAVHRELQSTKHDATQMVKVISALEQQQGALSEREAALRKAEEAAGQQVQAALVERDQAVAKESQARREMARLLERRRAEVEEAAKNGVDALSTLRARFEGQIRERDAELARALSSAAEATSLRDRAQREATAAHAQLSRATEAADAERRRLQRTVDEQAARLSSLNRELESATRTAREEAARAGAASTAAELAQRAAADASAAHTAVVQQLQHTCSELEARLGAARDAESAARRRLSEVTRAAADAQARAAAAADDSTAIRERERRFSDKRIAALQEEVSRVTERCTQLAAALDASGRAAAADVRSGLVRFEADLAGSAEELASWQGRAQELADALDGLQQAEEQVAQLRSFLASAEASITELSMQLASAAQREDQRVAEMQALRTECELARLGASRANARADNLQALLDAGDRHATFSAAATRESRSSSPPPPITAAAPAPHGRSPSSTRQRLLEGRPQSSPGVAAAHRRRAARVQLQPADGQVAASAVTEPYIIQRQRQTPPSDHAPVRGHGGIPPATAPIEVPAPAVHPRSTPESRVPRKGILKHRPADAAIQSPVGLSPATGSVGGSEASRRTPLSARSDGQSSHSASSTLSPDGTLAAVDALLDQKMRRLAIKAATNKSALAPEPPMIGVLNSASVPQRHAQAEMSGPNQDIRGLPSPEDVAPATTLLRSRKPLGNASTVLPAVTATVDADTAPAATASVKSAAHAASSDSQVCPSPDRRADSEPPRVDLVPAQPTLAPAVAPNTAGAGVPTALPSSPLSNRSPLAAAVSPTTLAMSPRGRAPALIPLAPASPVTSPLPAGIVSSHSVNAPPVTSQAALFEVDDDSVDEDIVEVEVDTGKETQDRTVVAPVPPAAAAAAVAQKDSASDDYNIDISDAGDQSAAPEVAPHKRMLAPLSAPGRVTTRSDPSPVLNALLVVSEVEPVRAAASEPPVAVTRSVGLPEVVPLQEQSGPARFSQDGAEFGAAFVVDTTLGGGGADETEQLSLGGEDSSVSDYF